MSGASSSSYTRCRSFCLQLVRQRRRQLQREVGAFAGVVERAVDGDVGERHRLGAAAADVLFAERLVAEVLDGQILERMRDVGVEEIAGDHHVGVEAAQRDAVAREHDGVELEVVSDFPDRVILEDRPQHAPGRRRDRRPAGRRRLALPRAPRTGPRPAGARPSARSARAAPRSRTRGRRCRRAWPPANQTAPAGRSGRRLCSSAARTRRSSSDSTVA